MDAVSACYISTGCNRTPHNADSNSEGLICFGACHSVAIYEPEGYSDKPARLISTLNGHKDKVICTQWIKSSFTDVEKELLSGSADHTVVVWRHISHGQYEAKHTLSGHTAAVTNVTGLTFQNNFKKAADKSHRTLVVSTAADSSVKVWNRQHNEGYISHLLVNFLETVAIAAMLEFVESQTINIGTGFVFGLAVILVPNTSVPMLAISRDDHKIHVYIDQNEGMFVKVMTLTGHEDWVRDLQFTIDDSCDILLASAAQDNLIRLWRFSKRNFEKQSKSTARNGDTDIIKMKENTFNIKSNDEELLYVVTLESVLSGHEHWVYSVRWHPPTKQGETGRHQPMCLLSASMDKTMILWKPDLESGVWVEEVRVGEVGGNTQGFYGGLFSPNGHGILGHSYQGSLHHWMLDEERESWQPVVTVKGHFDAVQDIDWDRGNGQFLLSVGSDQTTRLHAPWVSTNNDNQWYEIARPQVHGYDMQCISMIHRYKFISGADEKVLRVFDAPRNFIQNLCQICNLDEQKEVQSKEAAKLPEGASVPALGLSNKAIFQDEPQTGEDDKQIQIHPNEQYPELYFKPLSLNAPPSEEHLLQNTLWPETQKLYGHGFELFCVTCDPSGEIVASSCKAAKPEFSGVILWDVESWRQIGVLQGHTLTVTQIQFSHCGNYLLSVSRDRTWALFKKNSCRQSETDPVFSLLSCVNKKSSPHSRIIWACDWSHDDKYFITVSREKKAIVWSKAEIEKSSDQPKPISTLELPDSITAVSSAPVSLPDDSYLVSFGLDCGSILLYKWKPSAETQWLKCCVLNKTYAHHLTVKRLKFRPVPNSVNDKSNNKNILQLASCSLDHSVRIYNINIEKLPT